MLWSIVPVVQGIRVRDYQHFAKRLLSGVTVDMQAVLEQFIDAWAGRDVDALMELMTETCVFRSSIGTEPGTTFVGADAVRSAFARLLDPANPPAGTTEELEITAGDGIGIVRYRKGILEPFRRATIIFEQKKRFKLTLETFFHHRDHTGDATQMTFIRYTHVTLGRKALFT
jgi:ketosteroid isomerase-like protein